MKRILSIITVCALAILLFAGCSGSDDGAGDNSAEQGVDLQKVMTDINDQYGLTDMKVIDSEKGPRRYYQIEQGDIKQFAGERASGSSDYTEIILTEAAGDTAVNNIKDKLENHLRKQLSDAKSYNADQVAMLESCEVMQNGNFVYLVIGDQKDKIITTIEKALQ